MSQESCHVVAEVVLICLYPLFLFVDLYMRKPDAPSVLLIRRLILQQHSALTVTIGALKTTLHFAGLLILVYFFLDVPLKALTLK